MKSVVIPFLLFFALAMAISKAQAAQSPQLYILEGNQLKPVTKVQALIHLAQGQQEPVLKCTEQVLSDKATITTKK